MYKGLGFITRPGPVTLSTVHVHEVISSNTFLLIFTTLAWSCVRYLRVEDLLQLPSSLAISCRSIDEDAMRTFPKAFRQLEDHITFSLSKCTTMKGLKKIHAQILVSSLSQSSFLATQMVNICKSNARVDYGALVFNQVQEPNVFLYISMIRAYSRNNNHQEAIYLYQQLLRRSTALVPVFADRFTYPFVLKACAGLLLLVSGKQVHAHVFRSGLDANTITGNSLIEMYTKCDDLDNAHKVFDEMGDIDFVSWNTLISAHARLGQMRRARAVFDSMPGKTVVSWTALISGYTSIGCYADAMEIFRQMQLAGFEPDDITIVSVLPACAHLGALELGRWIHTYSDKQGLLWKTFICNALIEMYSKCGSINQAMQVFDDMTERDVISWSTMIGGLASHGRAQEAIQLFVEMESSKRVMPNSITFLAVLSACAHGGLLAEGLRYFDSMKRLYGLDPDVEHYGCVVDLLGRSGCIDQAVEVIESMPFPADAAIWGSLLSACRACGNISTATKAMERLIELEPEDTGNYVLLSNIYAATNRWDGVAQMRRSMRSRSLKKIPGCSLIEVNNVVQEFVAGNLSSPWFDQVSEMLRIVALELGMEEIFNVIEAEQPSI